MPRETVTGYCWPQSAGAGDRVALHLSSSGGRPVSIEIARVGATRDVVFSDEAVAAEEHATPKDAASNGCGWPAAMTLDVDPAWRSGYYEVVLTIDVDGKTRRDFAFFVVRPQGAAIVLALATNTWLAYNDFGGPNLYTGGTRVSMQRPMAAGYLYKPPGKGRRVTGTGAPDPQNAAHVGYVQLNHLSGYAGSAGWPDWELPFIQWAEREGFEIGVVTNADLEEHPEVLDDARLYLSVGHDEYWSKGMRDTVEAFVARGGNAAFFSGNTSLWQVRLEGDEPNDAMVGYKGFLKDDPLFGTDRARETTTFWSDHIVARPENHMTGVSFVRGGYHRIGKNVTSGLGGYTVHRADHWMFEGTGLGYGDILGADATVVGYECDGCAFTYRDGLPYPTFEDETPATFEILGTCPVQHFTRESAPRPPKPGEPSELEYIAARVFDTRDEWATEKIRHGHAVLGAYTNDAGATVVTSGSTDWAHGLAERDPRIEQVTRNILTRLG
ncbi:MAG: hypothetical protein QOF21_1544 [Actinomycetota bacterium]